MSEEEMHVKKIENGIVIDHLPGGSTLKILKVLQIDENFPGIVSAAMNVTSKRMKFKDILKIEGKKIDKKELDKLSLIAPEATINIVQNYEVKEKYTLKIPDVFEGIMKCPNIKCITNSEGIPKLVVEQKQPLKARCFYCQRLFERSELGI